ncbi:MULTISPECIES: AI-2E family transporter [Streptococcus]|uniref:AI-2E family transporter n=2 Tax=Streptococcus ruminantium TaxID=1917441 RepID=A0A2Z5U081_9STRE|nr:MULTISPECIES: AI-2E family transporter [Streptococcus]MDQ8759455.1 AI-2E family transporter [Streptococcus ruminantium]MDQ8764781.1 AI-2E family transporter [Streptococcus ruminantium]MDQ8767058.1 AI-2E family transporter [Streptococcus ruminantium]MDQ8768874.1 AI-2E family transporter [Streptococcus ruminantium]MDQ8774829.1 AI-2E family transporter [Streptococcus ruminantium]
MDDKNQKFGWTWFFRLFLNSQAVTFLLVMLLAFLTIFVFSKISFLLKPVGSFLEIILLPMILTGLLYYLLNPMVDWMEKHKIPRTVGISILFVLISLLIVWGLAVAIPSIQEQVTSFARSLPSNIQRIEGEVTSLLQDDRFEQFRPTALEMVNKVNDQIVTHVQKFSSSAVNWASNIISTTSQIIVAIMIMPFILFYLLRDGKELNNYITQYLPTKWREPIGTVLTDVNGQLSNYVRGQVTVAIIVALMFSLMFSVIGLSYPVTLGVLAGFLNLIPFMGSFLAMIPAVILGLIAGPIMLIKVLVVFMIEQTIEGRFVTPLIIGNSLNIHPITILFVLLTAGQISGILGVLLGIPIYASIKVLVKAIFEWYKTHSDLYENEKDEVVNEQ